MVNYACGFNQSESGKYFEWIIVAVNNFIQHWNIAFFSQHASLQYYKARTLYTSLLKDLWWHLFDRFASFIVDLIAEGQFDVELVVQCIRSSESPQTHNQALLLLATAAKLFPVSCKLHMPYIQ